MAFVRWETIRTMASRVNSTEALGRGLSHILDDLNNNMPDDLDKLQEPRDFTTKMIRYLKW